MKNYLKLFLVMMLSLSLVSCSKKVEENPETQKAFESYLDEQFNEYMTSDFLNYHYSLVDPLSYGIEKPEVTLGNLSTQSILDDIEATKEDLEELHKMEMLELTKEQQRIYQILEREFEETIELEKYLDFYFLFGESKVNDNLVTNFTEYRLQTQEDLDDFIVLLKDVDRYLSEGIERTREMADEGHIQKEAEKEAILEQCEKFISGSEIQAHVKDALNTMDLEASVKEDYERQVDQAVKESVIPAYEKLIALYQKLPKAENQGALCDVDGGKEYYAYLLKTTIGSQKSVDDWIKESEKELDNLIDDWIGIMFSNPNIYEEIENTQIPADNAQDMVKLLEGCLAEEFPAIDQVTYSVNYLDASVANDLVSAYYVTPPIDKPDQNTIKVNPNSDDQVQLFMTLAHEGFPGHLYQNNYRVQNNMHKIYHVIGNLGYSEGWAQYVGIEAYRLADIGSSDYQQYMKDYEYLNYLLTEYLDMRVNYDGWTVEDIADYMTSINLIADGAQDLYDMAVLRPAQYAPYSLGLMEMIQLRKKCEKALGDKFDTMSFNQTLLDANEVAFEFLEASVDEYIAAHK